jgi:hypothetical protein
MNKTSALEWFGIIVYGICLIALRAVAGKLFLATIWSGLLICGIFVGIFMLVVAWRTWTWRDRLGFIFSLAFVSLRSRGLMSTYVFWRFDLVLIPALDGEIRPSALRTFRFPKCQLDECCSLDPSAALMSSLFTASNVAASALVRIWRLIQPREFDADFFDRGIGSRHRLSLCHLSNHASQCAHSTVGECLAKTAWRHILCSQETRIPREASWRRPPRVPMPNVCRCRVPYSGQPTGVPFPYRELRMDYARMSPLLQK